MNRIPMTPEEHKKVMLYILQAFADFCDKHGLRYFLDAGTLIGAVRHKGYIPWDDDVDVCMPYEDYLQFAELVKTEQIGPHIYAEPPEDTIHPFMKLADDRTILVEYPEKNPMEVGVYIDIFVKSGIYDLSKKSARLCKKSERLALWQWFNKFTVYAWKNSSSSIKRAVAACGRALIKRPNRPLKWQKALLAKNQKKHPYDTCVYVTTLTNGEFHKCAPRECFDGFTMLEFEGRLFRGPKDYDTYLHCLYPGDYMQLPPPEKRKAHNTIVYWKTEQAKQDAQQIL